MSGRLSTRVSAMALTAARVRLRHDVSRAVVMGTARSGTSFMGATLGAADNAAYLREPVTARIFDVNRPRRDLMSRLHEVPPADEVARLADVAFSGRPTRDPRVTHWPSQFARRSTEVLVVKEVLPLLTEWFAHRYDARVLVLLRHPAAILSSWLRRDWREVPYGPGFLERFTVAGVPDSLEARLGATFAVHERAMLDAAATLGDRARVLTYEAVAEDPTRSFADAAHHLGLAWGDADAEAVSRATTGDLVRDDGRDHLVRQAARRISAWQDELTPYQVEQVRGGYESMEGVHYADTW